MTQLTESQQTRLADLCAEVGIIDVVSGLVQYTAKFVGVCSDENCFLCKYHLLPRHETLKNCLQELRAIQEMTVAQAEANLNRTPEPDAIISDLDALSDEQRVKIFRQYCSVCGTDKLPCYCSRDE